ncbi:BOS complex subunit TMEM147 [Brevipalpus obovatus]|uniref:BOS complex subunit TMEM147 n=1 Tax=Brevipalpus obovatus TaxID=246614 RepID=UPI003D9F311C
MSFYYFINCVSLTFLPLFLVYKFTALSEYGSIYRCASALFAYIVTQISKLLLIATLSAPSMILDHLVDCLGLYYVLVKQQKASLAQVKILAVAVGWNFGESLLTRFLDFYVNAKSMQFDWKHIITAIEANLSLLQTISVCTLIWTWSRGNQRIIPLVLLLYFSAFSIFTDVLTRAGLVLALSLTTFVMC